MNLMDYTYNAQKTAIYPKDRAIEYLGLGLLSEAGEVAGKIKKVIRDNNGVFDLEARMKIADECGDVLWYLAVLCGEIGVPLESVAAKNNAKLLDRLARGVIGGSGDER